MIFCLYKNQFTKKNTKRFNETIELSILFTMFNKHSAMRDLNSRHSVPKTDALPTALIAGIPDKLPTAQPGIRYKFRLYILKA